MSEQIFNEIRIQLNSMSIEQVHGYLAVVVELYKDYLCKYPRPEAKEIQEILFRVTEQISRSTLHPSLRDFIKDNNIKSQVIDIKNQNALVIPPSQIKDINYNQVQEPGKEVDKELRKFLETIVCENYDTLKELLNKGYKYAEDHLIEIIFGIVFSQKLFWKYLVIIIVSLILKKGLDKYCKRYFESHDNK